MNLKNKKSIIYIGISIIILAIIVVIAINTGTEKTKDGSKIKITKNEVRNLTLEDYSNSVSGTYTGTFTMVVTDNN